MSTVPDITFLTWPSLTNDVLLAAMTCLVCGHLGKPQSAGPFDHMTWVALTLLLNHGLICEPHEGSAGAVQALSAMPQPAAAADC